MISCPLKQTNEIDWVDPLKAYIRTTYGDDPERYTEECATLNRLRQDMRGAGKDSAAGRDLLYRYYGQLELLDLRFPVDENHIKISFTWSVLASSSSQTVLTHLPGSMLSPPSPPASSPWPSKRLQSYSTSPPCCHVMLRTRIDPRRAVSRQLTIPFRPPLACLPILTRTFCMLHQ